MSSVPIARLAVAVLLLPSVPALGGSIEIDLPAAFDRAHKLSPAAIAAHDEVTVAQGAVITAELAFTENPEIEAGAGLRLTTARPIDAEVRFEQNLELGRRAPRRRLAHAGVAQAHAEGDAALRALDLEVASAFYDAMFAERSAELAQRSEEFAQRAAEAADRRSKAGEITELDANLARSALGRARAAQKAARSERSAAAGRLGALIGAGPDEILILRGDLRPPPLPDLQALRAQAANRPDVRVLDAARAVAAAERDQVQASALPKLSVWAGYLREDTDAIVLGGLRITLPTWNRGQGEQKAAAAKERRAIATRDATARVAERQIADAIAAYALARDAVDAFEREVVPVLDDSEQLLQKTIDAGQIAVSDYLVARQEILSGRREYLERLLAFAKAAATARFVAGGAP
ncbi:MAG TPA: TolC family protein [Kofleriaceae bacterium]|jgi:cobalt-zinc-cadmium efflux system outer membrane protein|nr:TolC family protein [Kofleriaceae bacterium]